MAAVKELLFFCVFKALGLYACKLVAYFPKRRLAGVYFSASQGLPVCVYRDLYDCQLVPDFQKRRLAAEPCIFLHRQGLPVCVQGPLCLSTPR